MIELDQLRLVAENKKLKEALKFYADKDNWQMLNSGAPAYRRMNSYDSEKIENAIYAGKLARKTLKDL